MVGQDGEKRGLLGADDASLLWRSLFPSTRPGAPGAHTGGSGPAGHDGSTYRGRAGSPAGLSQSALANQEMLQESTYKGGSLPMLRSRRVLQVAEALCRYVEALQQTGMDGSHPLAAGAGAGPGSGGSLAAPPAPGGAAARRHSRTRRQPLAILIDDAQFLDSLSWTVLRHIRESCRRILIVVASRPMASPPTDYLVLSGQAQDLVLTAVDHGRSSSPLRASHAPGVSLRVDESSDPGEVLSRHPSEVAPPLLHPEVVEAPLVVVRVRLGPLGQEAARSLVAFPSSARPATLSAQLHIEWTPEEFDAALKKAGGVPLFVVELCRQRSLGVDSIGDTIQQLILSRIDQLPSQTQAVLKLAAVIGTRFSAGAIRAVDPTRMELRAVVIALRQLVRADLIKVRELCYLVPVGRGYLSAAACSLQPADRRQKGAEDDDDDEEEEEGEEGGDAVEPLGAGHGRAHHGHAHGLLDEDEDEHATWPDPSFQFDFTHVLVKESIYNSMAEAHRRDAHRRAAAWLEADATCSPSLLAQYSEGPKDLTLHWKAAGDSAMTIEYLERAGTVAYQSNALPEARRLYSELAEAAKRAIPGAPPPERERLQLLTALATRTIAFIDFSMGRLESAKTLAATCLRMLGTSPPVAGNSFMGTAKAHVHLMTFLLRNPRFTSEPVGPGPRPGASASASASASGPADAGGAGGGGALPPPSPRDEMQVARLECLLLFAWVNMSDGGAADGSPSPAERLRAARSALLKATDLVYASSAKSLHVAHARVLANLSGMLSTLGFKRHASRMLNLSYSLADKLDDDLARASACFDHATQLATEGRMQEAAHKFEAATVYQRGHAFAVDSLLAEALCLLLLGQFEGAQAVSQRALAASKASGNEAVALVHEVIAGFAAFLRGTDEQVPLQRRQLATVDLALERIAAFHMRHGRFAQQRSPGSVRGRWPADALARLLRGLHAWRTHRDPEVRIRFEIAV
eukprot:tig00001017_g6257.t1